MVVEPDGPVCGAETLRKKIRQRNVEVNSGAADSLILTKLWSDRNDQKPDEVSCGSHQEIWWRNDEWCGHDWQATPHSMTKRPLCPVCYPAGRSAGEIELFKFVQSYCRQHGVSKVISNDRSLLSRVMSPDGRKRMYGLDVYMPDLRLAFEYDGDYWRSDDVITTVHPVFSSADEYHGLKKTACLERGVQLMFVWEHEWKHRRSPVEDEVRSTIDDKPAILSSTLAGASTVTSR